MNIKNLLNRYQEIEQQIYNYFGYKEDWSKFCIDDCTEYFWYFGKCEDVFYCNARNKEEAKKIILIGIESYSCRIINNHIYKKNDLTLMLLNTECDGNIFLSIFDNSKEIKNIINFHDTIDVDSETVDIR